MDITDRRFFSNVSLLMLANIVTRVVSAVNMILIARLAAPELFGIYTGNISLARLTAILFSLGLNPWLLRNGILKREQFGQTIGNILWVKIGLGLFWFTLLILVAPLFNRTIFIVAMVAATAGSIWLEDITRTFSNAFQALLQNHLAATILVLLELLLFAATLVVWWLGDFSVFKFMIGRLIGSLVAVVISYLIFKYHFRIGTLFSQLNFMLKDTLPYAASMGLANMGRQADLTIITIFLGAAAAGVYSPSLNILSAILMLANSIHGVLVPMFSQSLKQGASGISQTVRRLSPYLTGLAILIAVGLLIFSPWLIGELYGPEYAISGRLLQIFSLIAIIRIWIAVTGAILSAVNWQSKRVYVQIIAVLVNVISNLVIVIWTDLGIFGVAVTYVISELVLFIGYVYYTIIWIKSPQTIDETE